MDIRGLYEKVFSSFEIGADSRIVQYLENTGSKKVMIIKRSWIFGFFMSWNMLLLFSLYILDIILIYLVFGNSTPSILMIMILLFNIIFRLYTISRFLKRFKSIYGGNIEPIPIEQAKEQLKKSEEFFTSFFNQTMLAYILLFVLFFIILVYIFFTYSSPDFSLYSFLLLFSLLVQIYITSRLKKRISDLDMDSFIFTPGRIVHYHHRSDQLTNLNLTDFNADNIKSITSNYTSYMGSILDYGEIVIDSYGGVLKLEFISHPKEVVFVINEFLHEQPDEAHIPARDPNNPEQT